MKQNKLKLVSLKDKGFTKRDWADLILLVSFLILLSSVVIAFIIAGLKLVTEVVQ